MTETREERIAYAQKLKFDLAVRDHADKLSDGWMTAGPPRRPLSRAYELLHRDTVYRAVVQWCLESVRIYYPGTMSRPTDEGRVAQLYCEGKFALSELPDLRLRQFLNSWTLEALVQGVLASQGRDAATGKRRAIVANEWKGLQPDFERAAASVGGQPIVLGIEVEIAKSAAPLKRDKTPKVKEWYAARILEWEAKGDHPSREQDRADALALFGNQHRELLKSLRPRHWQARGAPRKLPNKIGG